MTDRTGELREASRPGILLVDDVAANLTAMEAMLAGLNADVVTASSGKDALGHLLKRDFAMVLMDVRMPEMDGLEAAQMIRERERTRGLPIVFLTAYAGSEELSARAYALGAVDFLVKPVVPAVLLSKINAFLVQYEQRQQILRQYEELAAFHAKQDAERERELRSYQHYRAITDDPDGSQAPTRIDGKVLAGLTESYRALAHLYMRAVRLQDSRPRMQVRALAARLAVLQAGARDVVRIHLGALDDLTRGVMTADRQAIASDARLVLVELLGSLLDLYRSASPSEGRRG